MSTLNCSWLNKQPIKSIWDHTELLNSNSFIKKLPKTATWGSKKNIALLSLHMVYYSIITINDKYLTKIIQQK